MRRHRAGPADIELCRGLAQLLCALGCLLGNFARRISVNERFLSFTRGQLELRDLIYFASFIGFWLFLNAVIVEHRKAD